MMRSPRTTPVTLDELSSLLMVLSAKYGMSQFSPVDNKVIN
jgi:hypothetical protein